jgi:HlyD family secretion protein
VIKVITIVLAVLGLLIGVYAVAATKENPPQLPLAREASVNPFDLGVAALGIVEPAGRDVAIVAPEAGLVAKVFVDVGDSVAAGDPLFELDSRLLQADLIRAEAAVQAARADVDRWHALPRAEDVPPLEAALTRAQADLADREEALRLAQQVQQRGASNDRDVSVARFARDAAGADVQRAQADLAKLKAGGWRPDLTIAEATLAQRTAEVEALRVTLGRLTVRAPRPGRILRRSVEAGETATTDTSRPALLLGDLSKLSVRAQVDEEDIALIAGAHAEARTAVARTRGSVVRSVPLKLLRVEPYARPKADLTGANTERVDTRVIDVVFEVTEVPEDAPLFPGQAVDVFIDAQKK